MRVLFLNRSYFPDAEATGQLLTELCEDLAGKFNVTVIAGQPNSNPSQARFRRYGREIVNGVTIRRVWHTRFSKRSMMGRACNLVTFTMSAMATGLFGRRPDVVVCETDPPMLCLIGWMLSIRYRCRFVSYLQDIHPELGLALGKLKPRPWIRWLQRMFHRAYRRADCVVVPSLDMGRYLNRIGVPKSRIRIIPNWVDTRHIVPVKKDNPLRQEWNPQGHFLVMYSGNLGVCQDLMTILDTAESLRLHPQIRFMLIGNGVSKQTLMNEVTSRGLNNVQFADYQPLSRLHQSLSAADLHLVPVEQRAIHFLMPSKLYGILASGTPLIAIARRTSELSTLVEQESVGAFSPPGDSQALAERILWFSQWCDERENFGNRARALAVERFDRRHSISQFAAMLQNVCTGTRETLEPDPAPPLEPAAQPTNLPNPTIRKPEPVIHQN